MNIYSRFFVWTVALLAGVGGTLIVLAVVIFVPTVRGYLLTPATMATESPVETNFKLISAPDLVPDMVERVNSAVVSVVVTKDVPIYERYYEEWSPFDFWGGGFSVPRVRENGT